MTIAEQLLINLYAQQKVYSQRTIDMLCGIMEKLENKEDEPTGLLSAIVRADCDQQIKDLIEIIHQHKPDNTPLSAIHGIPDEVISEWLNRSMDAFEDGDEEIGK